MKLLINTPILIIICLLEIFIQTTHAQDSYRGYNYDSLSYQLNQAQNDTDRVKLLILLIDLAPESGGSIAPDKAIGYLMQLIQFNKGAQLIDGAPYEVLLKGYSAWRNGAYREALAYLKETVNLFDKQKKVIFKILLSIRIVFTRLNQQEERYKYYKEKLDYYLINGPVANTAACYHGIAGYYTYVGDYNLAISNYLKAASLLKQFNTLFYQSFFYNEIVIVGSHYSMWGNDQKARQYLEMAIAYLRTAITVNKALSDSGMLAICLITLSNMSVRNQKHDEALQYVDESINVCKTIAPMHTIAVLQKGFIYLERKQPAIAYPYLTKVKSLIDSLNTQIISTAGNLEIDFAFYRYNDLMKNYPVAEQYLSIAYRKSVNEKSHLLQLKYLKESAAFYERRQRPALALQHITQYTQLKDKLEQEQSTFKVAQYENESKELEQNKKIFTLRQERELQEAVLSKRNTVLWISFAALVLICISMAFLYWQFSINKRTLQSLRKTQQQLIMSEKMASLGELTAGIAHEIQNPLNFVNNFSDVNRELIIEMDEEIDTGNLPAIKAIAKDIKENEEKINHHGKRADAIVKGMLQHSRASSGKREPTNINALAHEYLRLSYHGLRAKDKSFNADFKTNFDESIGKIEVIPQDIGIVLLNLYNNAFYAVNEKKRQLNGMFEPSVDVTTKRVGDKVELSVRDNGTGIAQRALDKIFQPFFTTKPAGQGTGLGLSLSYDIVKAHGGEIKVESKDGEGSEFIIQFPVSIN